MVINDSGLCRSEIQEFNSKVRAFLIERNNVLIANYGGVILLPGGSIDQGEDMETALIRELEEEIGIKYIPGELRYLEQVEYYQRDYPTRKGSKQNRLVTTHYFVGKYKGMGKQALTAKEKECGFSLQLVPLEQLREIILNNNSTNPRRAFFTKELLVALDCFSKASQRTLGGL